MIVVQTTPHLNFYISAEGAAVRVKIFRSATILMPQRFSAVDDQRDALQTCSYEYSGSWGIWTRNERRTLQELIGRRFAIATSSAAECYHQMLFAQKKRGCDPAFPAE